MRWLVDGINYGLCSCVRCHSVLVASRVTISWVVEFQTMSQNDFWAMMVVTDPEAVASRCVHFLNEVVVPFHRCESKGGFYLYRWRPSDQTIKKIMT